MSKTNKFLILALAFMGLALASYLFSSTQVENGTVVVGEAQPAPAQLATASELLLPPIYSEDASSPISAATTMADDGLEVDELEQQQFDDTLPPPPPPAGGDW